MAWQGNYDNALRRRKAPLERTALDMRLGFSNWACEHTVVAVCELLYSGAVVASNRTNAGEAFPTTGATTMATLSSAEPAPKRALLTSNERLEVSVDRYPPCL